MATAEHVKSLIKAHIEQDNERFKTTILQIAANEAKHGHDTFARELKQYAEKVGKGKNNLIRLNNSGNGMFLITVPSEKLSDLVVSKDLSERIERILVEYRNRHKLEKYGLCNRRKILIEGRPGTGKTFTASVIASELDLPLIRFKWIKLLPSLWVKPVQSYGRSSIPLPRLPVFISLMNSTLLVLIEAWIMKSEKHGGF